MLRSERLTRAAAILVLVDSAVLNVSVALSKTDSKTPESTESMKNRSPDDSSVRHANSISVAICAIAALAYVELHASYTGLVSSDIRSLDWLITCPLLLIEMAILLGASATDGVVLLAATSSMVMVLTGWNAHCNSVSFCAGVFFFALTALCMYSVWCKSSPKRTRVGASRVVALAFALWPLYGLVAGSALFCGTSVDITDTAYNSLDVASKGIFGLSVALLVLSD